MNLAIWDTTPPKCTQWPHTMQHSLLCLLRNRQPHIVPFHIEWINIHVYGLLQSAIQINIVRPWDFDRNFPVTARITIFLWILEWFIVVIRTLIARFMGPTWSPPGADRTQVGPMSAPWTLLSGKTSKNQSTWTINFVYVFQLIAIFWWRCLQINVIIVANIPRKFLRTNLSMTSY